MRVGIIGAGLSGLAAARELRRLGHRVTVVEKSRGVGGRIASRRVGGTVVDHGTPVIGAPAGSALAALIDALPKNDAVALGDGAWSYRSGTTRLAKLMAEDLDILLGTRIATLRAGRAGIELGGEQGNTHGVVDRVIISAPAPQAADLLEHSPGAGDRVAALRDVTYAPAIMLLAGLRIPPPDGLDPFPVPEPFHRITAESVKGRPPGDGVVPVVARVAAGPSADLLDAPDDDILADLAPALRAACGADGDPAWIQVKRWRFALPESATGSAAVNPDGVRILVCGDGVAGGGLATVFASGIAAAQRVADGA